MRTTVTLDKDVYESALELSRVSGESLGKVISDLARRGLAPSKASKKAGRGFTTFDIPSGTPLIPASRVQQFIDEEGLF